MAKKCPVLSTFRHRSTWLSSEYPTLSSYAKIRYRSKMRFARCSRQLMTVATKFAATTSFIIKAPIVSGYSLI